MAKKKKSILWLIIIVFIIELIIAIKFSDLELNIPLWDRTFTKSESIQDKIKEEFQPDEHLKEINQERIHKGEKPVYQIYGSKKLYDFVKKPVSFIKTQTPVGTFQLLRTILIVDIVLLLIMFAVRRRLRERPSKSQILFESIYSFFEEIVGETLGKKRISFTPYIVTIFLFIWLSNMIGLIPIPGMMEPTRNLNVPLGLGIMAVIVVHATAIYVKGFLPHFASYVNFIKNPLFLLDIVGEVSKGVSISFRLFGNILGGAIIILVVSSLVKYILLPIGLNFFFGIFIGTIQAFVFTMLALTYIGVEISDDLEG